MSCPVGLSDTHLGAWKPTNMNRGAENLVRRLAHLKSTLPFCFAYHAHCTWYAKQKADAENFSWHEKVAASAFCHTLISVYSHAFPSTVFPYAQRIFLPNTAVTAILSMRELYTSVVSSVYYSSDHSVRGGSACKKRKQVQDLFPAEQYVYEKIFSIRLVPLRQVLWLDCAVYPLRDLTYLFNDAHYHSTGDMYVFLSFPHVSCITTEYSSLPLPYQSPHLKTVGSGQIHPTSLTSFL